MEPNRNIDWSRFRLHSLKDLIAIIVFAGIYFLAAEFGLEFAFVNASASGIWPATGISVAVLIIFGYRFWPGIFVGAFAANILTLGNFGTTIGIAIGNTLEGLLAAYLVNRFAGGSNVFSKFRYSVNYIFFAGALSTALSATIGVTSLTPGGLSNLEDYAPVWFTWWLGDMGGALILAPFLILLAVRKPFNLKVRDYLELFLIIAVIFISSFIIFGGLLAPIIKNAPIEYIVIPFLIWIAARFGQLESSFAVILFSIIANIGTINGFGPFIMEDENNSILFLQTFLSVISVTILLLSAVMAERKRFFDEEKRLSAIMDKSFDAVILIDQTANIMYSSPSVGALLGYGPCKLVNTSFISIVNPEDEYKLHAALDDLIKREGNVFSIDIRIKRKDGAWICAEILCTNLLREDGVNAIVCNLRDISERVALKKQLETETYEIKKAFAFDETLFRDMGEGLIVTDNRGVVIATNRAALKFLGHNRESFTGKKVEEVVRAEDSAGRVIPISERPIGEVLMKRTESIPNKDLYYVRQDGARFPVRLMVTPLILDSKLAGAIDKFSDITP